ncbi:DUF2076 domain-containing protein [Buchnera aphidicola (Rhopalosiphum padi)]|uniref:DUF2076 domain-containing protein n=1 Tax=Buchnera aphidicola subsp. Rhopalosiphum padi TaxID=98793 RepID=A0A4D6YJQ2_BUCRP|nr:DUF2076 domain-containing protein [Buchnera aphidicola]QCI24835.1 DUF2076 domain-containing protein [Buchnera aphidicola (Rhopalosiphum padi)]
MKDEEKNLIENLFHRLKKTEQNSSERDDTADALIQSLVKKQPYSSYYMVQTILIQETAIKKMSLKIEELKNQISLLNSDQVKKKPSFLSNFLKKDPASQTESYDNKIWKKNQNTLESCNTNIPTSSTATTTRNSGFLKNALQTATGVAGGMILGNMLMNIFNHTAPEEEVFDNINQSSISDTNEYDTIENSNNNASLINYDSQTEPVNNYFDDNNYSDFDETEHVDDSVINDDNFI